MADGAKSAISAAPLGQVRTEPINPMIGWQTTP
jgi:hypothetical protein